MLDRTEAASKGRRIAMLRATPETQTAMREWATAQGFDLAWSHSGWPQTTWDFDFHVTLIATENDVSIPEGTRWVEPVTVEPTGFDVFGIDDRVPVLRLADHHALTAMRSFFMTAYGAKPTFDEFKPHVSLSYKWAGVPDLASISPPPFPLVFDFLIVGAFAPKGKAKDGAMSNTREVWITDAAPVNGTRRTKDGYLVADVRAARIGIQQYAGAEVGRPDLQTVNVYRPAEEVFKHDSLASYGFKPVTINHPMDGVNAENWKRLAVGHVGGEVVRDGGFVRIPLVLMDSQAIQHVEDGTREISMGYDVRLEFVDGKTPDGQSYQAIQRDIRINHCAIVERGRAGSQCRIGDKGSPWSEVKREPVPTGDEDMTTRTVMVDGINIQTTDQGAQAIEKLQKQIADSAKLLADAAAALDAQKAKEAKLIEDHAKALKDAEAKIPTADALEAMLDKRTATIDAAVKITGAARDTFKGKSGPDVRKAVVAAKLGDDAVKDKSDDYIAAQFDTLAAIGGNGGGADPVRDALKGGITNTANDADKARAKYLADQANAWAA
jgi:hypothetical protein